MGRIVAIAGGDLQSNNAINKYMVKMVKKTKKNFLFIGTASGDAEGYIDTINVAFGCLNCEIKSLCLTTQKYTESEIDALLAWADIIYVGGGNTFSMMEIWRKHGVDRKLKEIYQKDTAILAGISAGAMCWFNCGHSDSEIFWVNNGVGYGWVNDLLDMHCFVYCPHYEERKDNFDEMLKEKTVPGLAMESDTAFVEENGAIYFIKSNESANAYLMRYIDERFEKIQLEIQVVSIE